MSRISAGLQVLAIVVGAAAAGAQAQGLVTTHKLAAALANELVGESVAACAQKGYRVVAVVVDLDGVRQAVLRGDGAPIHSMDNAYYKAYTIASLGLSRKEETTKQIADRMAKNPPTNVPQTQLPNVTYAQGAIAIMAGGNTIGGLGVSGAPGGQFDEECARTALAKIRDRMTRLKECIAAGASHACREIAPQTLLLGGRSMGGRAASMLAAGEFPCDGLLLLAYPLHPPGRPEELRDAHLAKIEVPVLCLNGTRDALCRRDLMEGVVGRLTDRWTMHWLEGADHRFHVPTSSARSDAEVP